MGTTAEIVLVGPRPGQLHRLRRRLEELEARWSRFRPTSELRRLPPGRPALVSPETFALLRLAQRAWERTGGRFDATVGSLMRHLGYDRTFDRLRPAEDVPPVDAGPPAPGMAGVVLDPAVPAVTVPEGVELDVGGLAKGFAADLLVDEACADGAEGAMVNIGGDLRARGDSVRAEGWIVGTDAPGRVLALADAGVATSSVRRRRWTHRGRSAHHVVDPGRGAPAVPACTDVTVVAGTAADAEVLATVWLVDPEAARHLLEESAAGALVCGPEGWQAIRVEAFLR